MLRISHSLRWLARPAAALTAALVLHAPLAQAVPQRESSPEHPALAMSARNVGMLMAGRQPATADSRCTVTLIDASKVLTAQHCIEHTHGHSYWVYFPFEGVRKVLLEDTELFCDACDTDLAVLMLDAPYRTIRPSAVGASVSRGTRVAIVGYGLSDPDLADYGVKRTGPVVISDCQHFANDGASLCFQYDASANPADEATTLSPHANCNNDSGGPMFTSSHDAVSLVGVASRLAGRCGATGEGQYVNATHEPYGAWLQQHACAPECSTIDFAVLVEENDRHLTETSASEEFDIAVPENAAEVIVTLNHARGWYGYPGVNRLDVELPLSLNPRCERFVEAEVCTAVSPAPGHYKVRVTRVAGRASYQLAGMALLDGSSR